MKYRKDGNSYKVTSSKGDKEYEVNADLTFCSCPSRKYPCKHLIFLKEEVSEMVDTKGLSKEVKGKKTTTIQELIESQSKELGRVLPKHLSPDRLCRIALTCIRLTPKLAECSIVSLLGSLFMAAELGLEPVNGQCYLIPFGNKVQFVMGYKGLVILFYRHESALSLNIHTVRENDMFNYEYGTEGFIKHKPASENRGKAIGYYAIGIMKGGGKVFKYMNKNECIEHGKKHSKSFDGKAWGNNFDGMAKKTVIIQISKTLPLSIQTQNAITADETSRDYRGGVSSAMDLPDKTDWNTEKAEEGKVTDNKKEPKDKSEEGGLGLEESTQESTDKDKINRAELEAMQVKLINKMNNMKDKNLKKSLKKQIDEIESKLSKLI